jgi:hypothetical protein
MSRLHTRWIGLVLMWAAILWPLAGYPEEPLGVPLAARVKVKIGPLKLNRKTGFYESRLTLTHRAKPKAPVYGPLSLLATRLGAGAGAGLADATGQAAQGPWLTVLPAGQRLAPRKSLKHVVVRFHNPGHRKFKPRFTAYGLLAPNRAPTAEAGSDRTVAVGEAVFLDGSASTDPDGHPLTYRWRLIERPPASLAALAAGPGAKSGFTVDVPGTYRAQLIVNDRIADSAPDGVAFSTGNSKPAANAGPDQTQPVGTTVTLDGSLSRDADGDALSFGWELAVKPQGSAAQLDRPNSVNPGLKLDRPGRYTARLIVSDSQADSDPDTVAIDTRNSRPVANAGPDQPNRQVGELVTLDGSASGDADHDPLSYRWSLLAEPDAAQRKAELVNAGAVTSSFVPKAPGDYVAQLIASDGTLDSEPDTVLIHANAAPTADLVISRFDAADPRVAAGSQTALTWSAAPAAANCAIEARPFAGGEFVAQAGPLAAGTDVVTPTAALTESRVFRLRCSRGGDVALSAEATVHVRAAIAAYDGALASGTPVLSWTAPGAVACRVSDGATVAEVGAASSFTPPFEFLVSKTYALSCEGSEGDRVTAAEDVVIFWGDATVADLAGVDLVTENAELAGAADLSFPRLREVGGQLLVSDNRGITALSFPALRRVGGGLACVNSNGPADVVLSLPALVSAGRFTVANCDRVTDIDAPRLAHVTGRIDVFGNLRLRALILPALETTGGLSLGRNPIAGEENPALVAVALPNLVESTESFKVFVQNSLSGLEVPKLERIGGELSMARNPLLASVRFPKLTSIGFFLTFLQNPVLAEVEIPPGTSYAGTFTFSDNDPIWTCDTIQNFMCGLVLATDVRLVDNKSRTEGFCPDEKEICP